MLAALIPRPNPVKPQHEQQRARNAQKDNKEALETIQHQQRFLR
jgi:hypothetical protein